MLILVRHGESTLNAEGVLVGLLDPELTELGRSQAVAAGGLLGAVGEVRTSSLTRARQTAALLGSEAPLVVDDRFIEVDYGLLDGTPLGQVPGELWERWTTDASFAPEGGESLLSLAERVGGAMEELFAEPGAGARRPEGDVVVVSHVSPIKAAVAWVLGADPLIAWRTRLSNASVTRIAMGPRGPQLVSFNEIPPL
jgi:probable phosphoglycerate mutase